MILCVFITNTHTSINIDIFVGFLVLIDKRYLNMSCKSIKYPECDGCLWHSSIPAKLTPAEFASMTCLHCFCAPCIKLLVQQHASSKTEAGRMRWFRCPVASCGLLIQSNQIKELSGKKLPVPIQYLLKSYGHVSKELTNTQRICKFHIDNYKW